MTFRNTSKAPYLLEEWRRFQGPERQSAVSLRAQIMSENPRMQKDLLTEAIDITTRHVGPRHPLVAEKQVDLAAVCQVLGEHRKAHSLLKDAYTVLADDLGDHHPRVTAVNKTFAGLCNALGDHGLARARYEHILRVEQRYLGSQDLMIATTKNNLGNACAKLGDLATGERLVGEAVEIASCTLPRGHPFLTMAKQNLARHKNRAKTPRQRHVQYTGHH